MPFYHECVLSRKGYKCGVTFRKSYRGSLYINQIVTADLGDKQGFAVIPPDDRRPHFLRIKQVQHLVPMAAQITDVVDRIFIIERAPGVLMWEMEDHLPDITEQLNSFVSSLEEVGLVHADIRPWNIFYDATTKNIKVIDWGFSYFTADGIYPGTRGHLIARGHTISQPSPIDRIDAKKTLQVLRAEISFESAWGHGPSERDWWPNWAKRVHAPD